MNLEKAQRRERERRAGGYKPPGNEDQDIRRRTQVPSPPDPRWPRRAPNPYIVSRGTP